MARIYLDKLSTLVCDLGIRNQVTADIAITHFFSGAALYANDALCVSWFPGGLAFKLIESDQLISSGKATPLKYFDDGHEKKGYAMFENPEEQRSTHWRKYLVRAINQAS